MKTTAHQPARIVQTGAAAKALVTTEVRLPSRQHSAFESADGFGGGSKHSIVPNAKTSSVRMGPPAPHESRVELKVVIRQDQQKLAAAVLGLADVKPTDRQITFYDTPSRLLSKNGLVLRSRVENGGDADTTVKLRPYSEMKVPSSWFEKEGFKAETDCDGAGTASSCSFTCETKADTVKNAAKSSGSLQKLLTDDQRKFISNHFEHKVPFEQIEAIGPIEARVWKLTLPEVGKVTVERWTFPDGTELLEVSIKVPKNLSETSQKKLNELIKAKGLDPNGPPMHKTQMALGLTHSA